MLNKTDIIIPRITNLPPSIQEMEDFSSNFTCNEWDKLSSNKDFCNFILEDLEKAKNKADNIL